MARTLFIIKNIQDVNQAEQWILNQFHKGDFPYFGTDDYLDKNNLAENQFVRISDYEVQINDWCERYLNRDQWIRMKGALRSGRLRNKRFNGQINKIKRIDLSQHAYHVLNNIAQYEKKTLSDTLIKHLERISFVLHENNNLQ